MKNTAADKTGPAPARPDPKIRRLRLVKRLTWLFFLLLIFEGALRKWAFPGFSQPLLLVRAPVLLWLYFVASRAGLMPSNNYMAAFIALAIVSFFSSFINPATNILVSLYGLHADFLYLPLIFAMPRILSREDVEKIGKWFLLLSIPMAILMVLQFQSGPYSIWNLGVNGEYDQLASAFGKGRPPGTFSFSTGPALFFPLAAAFLVYGITEKKMYSMFLAMLAGISFMVAAAVSGSRSLVVGTVMVLCAAAGSVIVRPLILIRFFKFLLIPAVFVIAVLYMPVFQEGSEVLSARFEQGGGVEAGILDRITGNFQKAYKTLNETPLLGVGIGMGTVAASQLLTGDKRVLWVENEWMRCLAEGGILFGLPYILLRIGIVFFMFIKSFKSLRKYNMLPILLFGACAPNVLMGQFGQTNILGFAVFGAGLCLAATKPREVAKSVTSGDSPAGSKTPDKRAVLPGAPAKLDHK